MFQVRRRYYGFSSHCFNNKKNEWRNELAADVRPLPSTTGIAKVGLELLLRLCFHFLCRRAHPELAYSFVNSCVYIRLLRAVHCCSECAHPRQNIRSARPPEDEWKWTTVPFGLSENRTFLLFFCSSWSRERSRNTCLLHNGRGACLKVISWPSAGREWISVDTTHCRGHQLSTDKHSHVTLM